MTDMIREELKQTAFSNGSRVVVGPSWSVSTLSSGATLHAHPDGSEEQVRTARRLGYDGDVGAMTRDHDPLHLALCDWLGIESQALAAAAGEPADHDLAALEEDAVLAVQRLMKWSGRTVPGL